MATMGRTGLGFVEVLMDCGVSLFQIILHQKGILLDETLISPE
jgi:hypothetical protein